MSIVTIDCQYVLPQTAAAYLIEDHGELAFVENNTAHAVPILLKTLRDFAFSKEAVRYIIITHVHLDHAGGTSALLKHCPNATVIAHPKAARHVIDPSRLVQSAEAVYGKDRFAKMFGKIDPVPKEKVYSPADKEALDFGKSKLHFLYTRGHANHHFCIWYSKENVIFTGDTFGLAYPALQNGTKPFLYATTSPTDFDYHEAVKSVQKIVETKSQCAYLTHFGAWHNIPLGAEMMMVSLEKAKEIFDLLLQTQEFDGSEGSLAYTKLLHFYRREFAKRGLEHLMHTPWIRMDLELNAQGIAFAAQRIFSKGK
ncbi:MAG: MBL fold metallo-hydrolase [Candidatus Hydrogenedentota bacterium]|nr:MAG: MBL fold metallo-hydrolase [Candidatus Hydrogenedentota bacterium]